MKREKKAHLQFKFYLGLYFLIKSVFQGLREVERGFKLEPFNKVKIQPGMKNFLDLAETFCRQDASSGHFFRKIYHIFFLT